MSARPEPSEEYRQALRRACVDAGLPWAYADRVERAFQATIDAGDPVPADPDPSAELLAARLEVERLRRVLSVARPRIAECIDEDEDSGGEMASSEAYERCLAEIDGALAAPPPDLAPLRELFLRVDRVLCGDALGADEVRLTALRVARDVAAEAFPSLPYPALAGEG